MATAFWSAARAHQPGLGDFAHQFKAVALDAQIRPQAPAEDGGEDAAHQRDDRRAGVDACRAGGTGGTNSARHGSMQP
jgi:hypothetical protein